MNKRNFITDFYRHRLKDYKHPVTDDVWAKIEQSLSKEKKLTAFIGWKTVGISMAVGLVVLLGMYFYSIQFDTQENSQSLLTDVLQDIPEDSTGTLLQQEKDDNNDILETSMMIDKNRTNVPTELHIDKGHSQIKSLQIKQDHTENSNSESHLQLSNKQDVEFLEHPTQINNVQIHIETSNTSEDPNHTSSPPHTNTEDNSAERVAAHSDSTNVNQHIVGQDSLPNDETEKALQPIPPHRNNSCWTCLLNPNYTVRTQEKKGKMVNAKNKRNKNKTFGRF